MNEIAKIYGKLLKKHKPQGWWPITEPGSLVPVHLGKTPVTDSQIFEVMVGAILTQNTSWKNVEKAISNLNKKDLISIQKIRDIQKDSLAQIIKPSGYYNQKAENLKLLADFLIKIPIRSLIKIKTGELRILLLNLNGIGPETADSILLYAFQRPVFVIDTYTKRLFSKKGLCSVNVSYHELQELFHKSLPKNVKLFKEYHALIVAEGKWIS